MQLHPFQQALVAEYQRQIAAGVRRIIIVVPTGGGKTVVASDIITAARAFVVFIAHRDELLVQARDKLKSFGVTAGIIKAGRDKDLRPQSLVQVCGIQTLHARAIRAETMEMPQADIVFIDEAHHVPAMTYQAIIAAYPNAIIVGLTATPCRGDGRGLGNTFESMIEGPQIGELINLGYLCKLKIFAPAPPDLRGVQVQHGDYVVGDLSRKMNTEVLVGDLAEHWLRHAQRRRTVVFAVDVAHSVDIVKQFCKSGIRAEHLDGATSQADREAILARLASGETEVVSNCQVLTEGYDLPDLGCIALARPTRSLGLFRQMIGRGLRAAEGKTDVIILDHSGGVHRHGRPDDPIEWTLHEDKRATNAAHAARVAAADGDPFCACPACGELRIRGMACDACGWKPKPKARAVGYIDENLVELGAASAATETDRITFYCELRGFQQTARKKDGSPYHRKWAQCQYKDKEQYAWTPELETELRALWRKLRRRKGRRKPFLIRHIAKHFATTDAIIHKAANRLGLPRRQSGVRVKWTADENQQLRKLWLDNELSVQQIALQLGRTKPAVIHHRPLVGLPPRYSLHSGFQRLSLHAWEGMSKEERRRIPEWRMPIWPFHNVKKRYRRKGPFSDGRIAS